MCVAENLSRVFLFEWPLYNLWVMRIYIVWVKGKKVTLKNPSGRESLGYLAGRPYPRNTREIDSWAYTWNRSQKQLENMFFTQKQLEKYGWYKSLPKANKKNKNIFGLIHIRLSTHTSHLNMYNHKNEISIHWAKSYVLCVSIKCGIVLSLEWSFNGQFNQAIHN